MKVCLGSRWGGTVPAIRTLWANAELQEHKDLQHEQMFSATLVIFVVLIKIYTMFCSHLRWKHFGRHLLTTSTWQMQ